MILNIPAYAATIDLAPYDGLDLTFYNRPRMNTCLSFPMDDDDYLVFGYAYAWASYCNAFVVPMRR